MKRSHTVDEMVCKHNKIPKLKYDVELLNITFDNLEDSTVGQIFIPRKKHENSPQVTLQFLRKPIVLTLNELDCLATINGGMALFNFQHVKLLKHLLHYLMKKLNVNPKNHVAKYLDEDESMHCFQSDSATTYYYQGKQLGSPPKYALRAKILIKIMGLDFRDEEEQTTVKLLLRLHQVEIVKCQMDFYDEYILN